MLPSIFLSHGAPTLAIETGEAQDFLRGLGEQLGKPKAILCVSAHWETEKLTASVAEHPKTIHDFGGFPHELYRIEYNAPGAKQMVRQAERLLQEQEIWMAEDRDRGLDHGAWVPLRLMYPEADIPVAQISICTKKGPAFHLKVGRALAPLREQDVLILATGGAVHNLRKIDFNGTEAQAWAVQFDAWLQQRLVNGETDLLLDYRTAAPYGVLAHPTEEHLIPLFVALGAGTKATELHRSFQHGSLSMAAYAFE